MNLEQQMDWFQYIIVPVIILLALAVANFCFDAPFSFQTRQQCPKCLRVYPWCWQNCSRDGVRTYRIVAARRPWKWQIIESELSKPKGGRG